VNLRTVASTVAAVAVLAFGVATAPAEAAKPAAPSWAPAGSKACPAEDSPGPCYWDAAKRGNRKGQTFYVTRDQRVVRTADLCVVAATQAKFKIITEDAAVKVCVRTVRTDADAKRAYRYAAVRAIG